MDLVLNGNAIGRAQTNTSADDHAFHTCSLDSILELKAGDQVWLSVQSFQSSTELFDNGEHFTHFTGFLLQENVASSLNSIKLYFICNEIAVIMPFLSI